MFVRVCPAGRRQPPASSRPSAHAATETPMTREAIPLVVPDVGTFARALGRSLVERRADKSDPPGHVELLNLLARAAGHRSYQGLRAAARLPGAAAALDAVPAAPALTPAARKALTQFDAL